MIFNLFKRKKQDTNYPVQALNEKQLALIQSIDEALFTKHIDRNEFDNSLVVKSVSVPLMSQHWSVNVILAVLEQQLAVGDAYMPRSIALIVEGDGTWVFLYAVRLNAIVDVTNTKMFIELLNRTNNARTEYENQVSN